MKKKIINKQFKDGAKDVTILCCNCLGHVSYKKHILDFSEDF